MVKTHLEVQINETENYSSGYFVLKAVTEIDTKNHRSPGESERHTEEVASELALKK